MAHFCKLDENNIVVEVIVINNSEILDENGDEQEQLGKNYISESLGFEGTWIQTSYNGTFRNQYAGINFTYDATNDVFIEPKEYDSWVLGDDFHWQPPISQPVREGYDYLWDEENLGWIEEKHPNWNEETQSWDDYEI